MSTFKILIVSLILVLCIVVPVFAEDIIPVGDETNIGEEATKEVPVVTEVRETPTEIIETPTEVIETPTESIPTQTNVMEAPPSEEGSGFLDNLFNFGEANKGTPVIEAVKDVPVEAPGDKTASVGSASIVFDANQWSKASITFSVVNNEKLDMSKIRFTNPDTLTEYKVNSITTNTVNNAKLTKETTISNIDLTDYDYRRQGVGQNRNQWVVMYEDTDGIGHVLRGNTV